jgi:hypothetical protein
VGGYTSQSVAQKSVSGQSELKYNTTRQVPVTWDRGTECGKGLGWGERGVIHDTSSFGERMEGKGFNG